MITQKTKNILAATIETEPFKALDANHVGNFCAYSVREVFAGYKHVNEQHIEKTLEGIYQLSQSVSDYSGNGSTFSGRVEAAKQLVEYLAEQGITRGKSYWVAEQGRAQQPDGWVLELR